MGFLTGWNYRKSHVINSASGAGTNYAIRIVVHYGSGTDSGGDVYLNSKCKTDFGDIRFTASDGTTLLNYWMETKTDSDKAIFWVKIPGDLGSSNQTIYVYYGNTSATTTSNGGNTFLLFDPCDNLNQWTKYTSGNGDVTVSSGTFKFYAGSGNSNGEMLKSSLLGLANAALHFKLKHASTYDYEFLAWLTPDDYSAFVTMPNNNAHAYVDQDYGGAYQCAHTLIVGGTTLVNVFIGTSPDDTWQRIQIRSKSGKQEILWDDVSKNSQTQTYSWSNVRVVLCGVSAWNKAHEYYVDDIFVRKFVDPEPAHSTWGNEETPTGTNYGAMLLMFLS